MRVKITQENSLDAEQIVANSAMADTPGAAATLRKFLDRSTYLHVGRIDGEIACVCGVLLPSIISSRAYLWMITTTLADKHQFLLVRHSQIFIRERLKEFERIVGHTEISQPRSIRWLKWLGAKFGEPVGK